jgi:hypothetical protein
VPSNTAPSSPPYTPQAARPPQPPPRASFRRPRLEQQYQVQPWCILMHATDEPILEHLRWGARRRATGRTRWTPTQRACPRAHYLRYVRIGESRATCQGKPELRNDDALPIRIRKMLTLSLIQPHSNSSGYSPPYSQINIPPAHEAVVINVV